MKVKKPKTTLVRSIIGRLKTKAPKRETPKSVYNRKTKHVDAYRLPDE